MPSPMEFKSEIEDWARALKVEPSEIHIRSMGRKWGSCSSKGRLTFSSELIDKPFEFRSKVVVHELLHLRYPVHGKMFNTLLLAQLRKKGIDGSIIIK